MIDKGSIIEFGEYPQTIKDESIKIIKENPEKKGYYLGSDGCNYALVKAKTFGDYAFSNGKEIVDGEEYFFKVEPVQWEVLDINDGALLYTKDILDAQIFDMSSPKYAPSAIRQWLNNYFFKKTFSLNEQKQIIEETDKVFLLTVKDLKNSQYGYDSNIKNSKREKKPTDYAKANYAFSFFKNGNGNYWLQDENQIRKDGVCYVDYEGNPECNLVPYGINGVVVAIKITL